MKKVLFIFVLFLLIGCHTQSREQKAIEYKNGNAESILPKPIGLLNDFSYAFTPEQRNNLEDFLQEYEQKTTNQIAVVTIGSIVPYQNIEDFSTDLGNFWGVGMTEKDNGLLIVMSMNDRNVNISTGTGTAKVISDEFLKKTIDNLMIPKFKEDKFYDGVKSGLDEIIKNWK